MKRLLTIATSLAILALLSSVPAAAQSRYGIEYVTPATRVLGLYDSTDPTDHQHKVVLERRVRKALSGLGLPLVLRDVNDGLPDAHAMRGFRAVVTCFGDATMKDAPAYLKWAEEQLRQGRKLLVLDNFGAYQDQRTSKWMGWDVINKVLEPLGVSYRAAWTDDPKLLDIVKRDPAVFSAPTRVDEARHYYWFEVKGTITPHLILERTAKDGRQRSAVVFTSPRGGMALTRYYESPAGKPILAMQPFLERALFSESRNGSKALFVLDPDSPEGHQMERNLHWIRKYARLEADFVHLQDFASLRRHDLLQYGALVMASYGGGLVDSGKAVSDIERWVREDGGGFVSLFPLREAGWDRMFGVERWSEKTKKIDGMRWKDGFFPGLSGHLIDGDSYSEQELHDARLASDVRVHAVSARKDGGGPELPILWSRRHGQGRVVYRNDGISTQKTWRGATLQTILKAFPVAAAPILNALVYFVDDCPMPMWSVKREPIQSEFGMTDTDFYRDVWWRDLIEMAKRFDLALTFVLVFSYDDKVETDFTVDPFYAEAAGGVPEWMAREAVRLGHEVGLHGYNHQSLVRQGGKTSKGWVSREAMTQALRLARVEWERLFGEGTAPFTYIAPNNHIHRAGKEAVRDAFPEIRVMAAQYLNEGDIAGQEFQVDPDVAHFMDMPRVSSEFYTGSHNAATLTDAIMLLGAWTHFVHPDDVYDPDRNGGMGWKGLKEASYAMLERITTAYPWLRSLTARDAYHELVRFSSGAFATEVEANKVIVTLDDGSSAKRPFLLRVDPGTQVLAVEPGRVLHAYPGMGLWYLEGRGPKTTVTLSRVP